MTSAELKAIRETNGWSQHQVAVATGYSGSTPYTWETGRRSIPPDVVMWALALPPVPRSGAYPPTTAGLRIYMQRKHMRCIELADFCGVSESTVERWIKDQGRMPLAICAWLAAGAPPYWRWAPPGVEPNVLSSDSKPVGQRAMLRPIAHTRPRGSRVISQWARGAKPRPRRARVA